jgi:hypothetical protein
MTQANTTLVFLQSKSLRDRRKSCEMDKYRMNSGKKPQSQRLGRLLSPENLCDTVGTVVVLR